MLVNFVFACRHLLIACLVVEDNIRSMDFSMFCSRTWACVFFFLSPFRKVVYVKQLQGGIGTVL